MTARWSNTSMLLHWAGAAMVVGLVVAGFVMTGLAPDAPGRAWLSRAHTAGGLTLMALTVTRLVVRLRGQTPAPLPLTPWHRLGVTLVHGVLYGSLFGLGASGVLTAVGSTWPGYLRGAVGAAPQLEHLASRQLHEALVFVVLTAVVLHVAGVFIHQYRQGATLRRMVPLDGR